MWYVPRDARVIALQFYPNSSTIRDIELLIYPRKLHKVDSLYYVPVFEDQYQLVNEYDFIVKTRNGALQVLPSDDFRKLYLILD